MRASVHAHACPIQTASRSASFSKDAARSANNEQPYGNRDHAILLGGIFIDFPDRRVPIVRNEETTPVVNHVNVNKKSINVR